MIEEPEQPGYYEDEFSKEIWKKECKKDEYITWQLIGFCGALFAMLIIAGIGRYLPLAKEIQNFGASLLFIALALNFVFLFITIEPKVPL